MWEDYGIFVILGFLVIATLLSYRLWGDAIYIAFKHWRISGFVLICALFGAGFALQKDAIGHEASSIYLSLYEPAGGSVANTINNCRNFVAAKMNGEIATTPVARGFMLMGQPDNWELCARTFGMNYWKYDISVNGQNGGQALCAAYAREHPTSGKVRAWCDTVFSPTDQI